MRVSDQILECVAFIGIPITLPNGEQGIRFGGTAFFVEEDAHDDPPKVWSYLVTARHVAEQVAHSTFYVRLNTRDGQSVPVYGSGIRWWIHPTDHTADVAVIRWFPPADIVQYRRINTKDLVTNQTIADGKVGPGDDAMMIGLFSGHPGVQQNVPVVRLGSVAMIPREPVATEEGLMDAYLVEGRSIGGLSGSPVWVTETMAHSIYDAKVKGIGTNRLLGLVHGHWSFGSTDSQQASATARNVHSGIAIVVPAQKILDVIAQPEMMALKEREKPSLFANAMKSD